MDSQSQLLDLLAEWNEAVLAGKAVSVESLAPNDPVMQQRLREALIQRSRDSSGIESTTTGVYVPTEDDQKLLALEFPGFHITREIGRGGMGIVFEADDILLGRKVAIKTIRPELALQGDAKLRFLQEARAAASIRSDHVVTIHRVDEIGGVPFIAMEFLKGQPLSTWMKEHRATRSHIGRIGYEIALGLVAAHESGHIHRDIKPGNIWLEAPKGRVKILDFGLARTIEADFRLTRSGVIVGTPAYMAPEQARNEIADHRADLFSLGAILFQLATGRRPFQGHDVFEILENLATQTPPAPILLNPEIGEPLSTLITRLLAKDPVQRPQSAREVASELRRIYKEKSSSQNPPQATPTDLPSPRLQPTTSAAPAKPPADAWTDIELDAIVVPEPAPRVESSTAPHTTQRAKSKTTTAHPNGSTDPQRTAEPRVASRIAMIMAAFLIIGLCATILLKLILAKSTSKPKTTSEFLPVVSARPG